MAMLTVRNLSDPVHRALRARAEKHGRSTEAEVRLILERAVMPDARPKLGTMLVEIGREVGLDDEEVDALTRRDKTPTEPVDFS